MPDVDATRLHWTARRYTELPNHGRADDGDHDTRQAREIFPKYNVVQTMLEEIERLDYLLDVELFAPRYTGVDGVWTDHSRDWVVFASHPRHRGVRRHARGHAAGQLTRPQQLPLVRFGSSSSSMRRRTGLL
jgi:hypothetical protein